MRTVSCYHAYTPLENSGLLTQDLRILKEMELGKEI